MTELCPTCSDVMPSPAWTGRRRTYCSDSCRREMVSRRRHLDDLETELAEARYQESVRTGTWKARWRREVAWLNRMVTEARARIPEEMQ